MSNILDLKKRLRQLEIALDLNNKRQRIQALKDKTSQPDFWQDANSARKFMQEIKLLENQINLWEKLDSELKNIDELAAHISDENDPLTKEIEEETRKIKKQIDLLETETYLSGEYDQNNAIVSINAGAGGTDAMDWAQILLRMYLRYCEDKGFTSEMVDVSYGEEAGVKSVTLIVSGPFAYGLLKNEKGVHRLVRMSPFNADGKRHTSFASVDVTPEVDDDIQIDIPARDLRVDTYRASGPGGQNVNKVSSAIRITHIPTNIVVACQSDRSQHKNRDMAMKILKAKLYERLLQEKKEKIEELKGPRKDIAWGSQIRSYVFAPYTLVKDHRTNVEMGDVNAVIDGDIGVFIEAMLKGNKKQ